MRYVSGSKLDERIIRCDLDLGYKEGRQFGRGKSGGQVRPSCAPITFVPRYTAFRSETNIGRTMTPVGEDGVHTHKDWSSREDEKWKSGMLMLRMVQELWRAAEEIGSTQKPHLASSRGHGRQTMMGIICEWSAIQCPCSHAMCSYMFAEPSNTNGR